MSKAIQEPDESEQFPRGDPGRRSLCLDGVQELGLGPPGTR